MASTLPNRTDTDSVETQNTQSLAVGDSTSRSSVGRSRWTRKRALLGALLLVGGAIVVFGVWTVAAEFSKPDEFLVFYTVTRSDLPITVVESGNLESQVNTKITCEVESVGYDRSGVSGTPILFIVPNGKFVTEGELLVELDAAPLQDRLDSQVLATERARSEQIQANARYENQILQNKTTLAKAELDVDLAKLSLDQYGDEEGGTFQIDLQDVDLAIQEAQARRLIQETNLQGVKMLKTLGYRSKGDLEQARLSALAADRSLYSALASRKELTTYSRQKAEMQLDGTLGTAERGLIQAENNNKAEEEQAEARKTAADRALEKEEEKLTKYREQLELGKIHAPHDGMATYAVSSSRYSRSSGSSITEGALVRQRQEIITLPDLSTMQVKTAVHESVLDRIHKGLPASVKVDAFPNIQYKGSVQSVAVLPDQGGWLGSDIKVYETIVTIDEEVERLKPGMTAVVEIQVERLKDVLSVPVQAIVQVGDESWCYVDAPGGVERRSLELGKTNDKFVEICSGLSENDRVVLNPMSVVDRTPESEATISPDADSEEFEDTRDEQKSTESGDSSEAKDSDQASEQQPTPGGGPPSAGEQRQRGGSFNLMQFDKDKDGKVSVDGEVPESMRPFVGRLDTDKDGFLSTQEIAAMRSASPGGAGQGRGAGSRMGPGRNRPGGPPRAAGGEGAP